MSDKLMPRWYVIVVRFGGQYGLLRMAAYSAADVKVQARVELDQEDLTQVAPYDKPMVAAQIVRIGPAHQAFALGRGSCVRDMRSDTNGGSHTWEQVARLLDIHNENVQ